MKSSFVAGSATLIAAGAFTSPAMAATVDYTASSNGTAISLIGDSTAEYNFTSPSMTGGLNTLQGKIFSGNTVGAVSTTPYYPTATSSNQMKSQNITADGYYGLYFRDGAQTGGPVPADALPQYTGFALVDRGGTHISQIDFQPVTSAVPEPASWALMLLGFGAAGAALRQRRRTGSTAAVV